MTPEREDKLIYVLNRRQGNLAVVLENVEDPHNIFAVMRTCDAVGIQDVYVINTRIKEHRKFGKRSSSSAAKWVTMHKYDNLEECMNIVAAKYGSIYASYIDDTSTSYLDIDYTRSMVLVFGNERDGISDDMLAHCTGKLVIPQCGMIQSLNISVACAVALYEAKRQKSIAGHYNGVSSLPEKQWDSLAKKWRLKL